MSLRTVRGTHDLLPDIFAQHLAVINTARSTAELYGFREMATPIFEFSDVFSRTLGDQSDIVTKEMYSFQDKGGDWLTLRPEGTAGIARAFISEGLAQHTPLKVFYQGPMFRYERPQKGRMRQFHQLGIELIGVASPVADVECLSLAYDTLERLSVSNKAVLEINSIGDTESRKTYVERLTNYLTRHRENLSPESQRRLATNPLRILDSKDDGDRSILEGAPNILDDLNQTSRDFLFQVEKGLKRLGIGYQVNPRLVRGLDYYCHTVFEFRTSALGSQDAILSGGRYDQLIQLMGGPATPGFGWAAGIERLVMLREPAPARERPVVLVALGPEGEDEMVAIAAELRAANIVTELTYSGNLSKRMKKASSLNARYAVIVGTDEIKNHQVTFKDLDSGEQKTIARTELITALRHLSRAQR